ncbi:armadillo repeat-containing protein 5-like [Actinia tenebrosa]|uniref:Armadillo repeat-containing protein 5-like n=1 Tax=Actinia tenebrosa TaxID=6105 RepID=A0A6P8H8H4_ACTTE|nr:armadillo repeat-containing protein 5-like [Actinia tenebrosa]
MASSIQITDNLVQKLSSSSISSVKKALAIVAKLTKRSNEADLFREKGGLGKLLGFLKRPNNSIIDMAMSAIANCAMFNENKTQIRRLDGIQPIVLVLKNLKSMSIRNRAARALANLAENDQNAIVIEELGAIEELVKLLNETTDSDCQQTVLRGLKILSTTQSSKKKIYENGGVKTLVELLKSDKPIVAGCSVKAISELTKNCSKEIAQQVQEFEGIKEIIKLTNCDKASVSSAAFMTTVNLCVHAHVRVSIGSEGGIAVLYKEAAMNLSSHMALKALEGLCYCCREAVNRNRVYECGGIELLLKQLYSSEHPSLHRKIITAFNCFYYHEKCLQLLLNNGIVAALLAYLKKVISSCYSVSHSEDDNDPYDHESFTSDFSSPSESPRSTHSVLDNSTNISCKEAFLEEAENLAIQVRDAKESSRVLTFKRKPRNRVLSSSTPTVKTIDQSPSLFSFSSLQSKTETTSMMSTCTLSSTSMTSRPTAMHSFPQGLICSTPTTKSSPSTDVSIDISPLDFGPSNDISSTSESCCKLDTATSSSTPKTTEHDRTSHEDSKKSLDVCSAVSQDGKEDSTMAGRKHHPLEEHSIRSTDSSPLLTPPNNEKSHIAHHTFHGPGHNAILLLSRFSHMSDQSGLPHLLTRQCFSVLLDYLCLVNHPSPKCTRLLNSLTLDPQCFESLVGMGIACDIHRQLCCGYMKGYACIKGQEAQDSETTTDKETGTNSDINIKCVHPPQIHIPHSSITRCRSIGDKLMENLSCQSQTPFGKGVLMHLLAKGCGEDWLGCVLMLPLVCRSENLRNKLMIKNYGLKMLCDLLVSENDDQVFAKVVISLKYLSSSTGLTLDASTKLSSTENYLENQTQMRKRKLDSKKASDEIRTKCPKLDLTSSPYDSDHDFVGNEDGSPCKYYNNHHGPCNIKFQVDSGEQIPADPRILSGMSEMFAAMLSSNYKEGSMSVIPIHQVSLDALTCVIHHGYGCTLSLSFDGEDSSESSEVCRHLQAIFDTYNSKSRFQFMVELLAIADRFLMAKLKCLAERLLISLATESNIVSLILSAAHYHSKTLCEFGLSFLLLKVSDLQHQFHAFRDIFRSHDKCKLLDILYEVLSHQFQ